MRGGMANPLGSARRFVCLLGALALAPATAQAFDPIGHELIEAQAYRRLIEGDASWPDGAGGSVRGEVLVAALISDGVLAEPACFGESATGRGCREDRREDPTQWWPPLRSGRMDFVLDRHHSALGQCYHFLAHPDDDARPGEDRTTGVPAGLIEEPYRRCMRLLGTLVEVAAGSSAEDARGLDNDVYALLHAVADAFSPAHVQRDAAGRIRWLRAWNPLPWTPAGDAQRRHRFHDPRDASYLRPERASDERCDLERRHPYAIAPECLTPQATQASAALADVLALIYRMRRRARSGLAPPTFAAPVNRADWAGFVAQHLLHSRVGTVGTGVAPAELDAWPRVAFGLGADLDGATPRAGAHLGVMVPLFVGRDRFLPFIPNASLELGWLPGDGFHAAADLTFSLPLAAWLWVGAAPFRLSTTVDPQHPRVDLSVGFMAPRVDLFHLGDGRGLWVRLAGPGYFDLVSARWQWQAALTVGAHFDATPSLQPDRRARAHRSPRRDAADAEAVRSWDPPPFTGANVSPWPEQTYLYAGFGGRTGGGIGGGVELLRSLPRALHFIDLGGRVDASGPGGGHGAAVALDAVLRVRPRPFLSIDLVPVSLGAEFDAAADWTLTGRLGASVLLGPLRVAVDLPRLDYRRLEIDTARGLDLRFSVDLTEVFQWSGTAVSLGAHGGRGVFPSP